jgi:hypothetical protein
MEPPGAPLDTPPPLREATPQSSRRRVRTQASGKGAIVVAVLATLMWLVVNSQALITLAMGLLFAVAADGWLARRALAADDLALHPVGEAEDGRPLAWSVEMPRVARPLTLRPAGDRATPPLLVDRDGTTALTLPAVERGVVHVADVDLLASGPIGLCRAARRYRLVPARPRIVGAAAVSDDVRWPQPSGVSVDLTEPTPRGDDQFRGVRPYQRGDERRKVHWKATARAGRTMVREEDGTGFVSLQVVLEDGDAAGLAARVVAAGRREGWTVQLVTVDATPDPPEPIVLGSPFRRFPDGPAGGLPPAETPTVAQVVVGLETARRQLATATTGHPITPPWAGLRCTVTAQGTTWT